LPLVPLVEDMVVVVEMLEESEGCVGGDVGG
jgi:hypothetical protein